MVAKMEKFAVEKITDTKVINGMRYYQVEWSRSWEPEDFLMDCPSLIKDFWKNYKESEKCQEIKEEVTQNDYDSIFDSHMAYPGYPENCNSGLIDSENALFSSLQNFHSDENVFQDILEEWKNTKMVESSTLSSSPHKLKRNSSQVNSAKESDDEPIAKSSRRLKRKACVNAMAVISSQLKTDSVDGNDSDTSWKESDSEDLGINKTRDLQSPILLEENTDQAVNSVASLKVNDNRNCVRRSNSVQDTSSIASFPFKLNPNSSVHCSSSSTVVTKVIHDNCSKANLSKCSTSESVDTLPMIKVEVQSPLKMMQSPLNSCSYYSLDQKENEMNLFKPENPVFNNKSDKLLVEKLFEISDSTVEFSEIRSKMPNLQLDHSTSNFNDSSQIGILDQVTTPEVIKSSCIVITDSLSPVKVNVVKTLVATTLTPTNYFTTGTDRPPTTSIEISDENRCDYNSTSTTISLASSSFNTVVFSPVSSSLSTVISNNVTSSISSETFTPVSFITSSSTCSINLNTPTLSSLRLNPSSSNSNSLTSCSLNSSIYSIVNSLSTTLPNISQSSLNSVLFPPVSCLCPSIFPNTLTSSSLNSVLFPPVSSLCSTVFSNTSAVSNQQSLNFSQEQFSCDPRLNRQNDLRVNQSLQSDVSAAQFSDMSAAQFSDMSAALKLQQAKLLQMQLLQTMNETATNIQLLNSTNLSNNLQNQITAPNITHLLQNIQNINLFNQQSPFMFQNIPRVNMNLPQMPSMPQTRNPFNQNNYENARNQLLFQRQTFLQNSRHVDQSRLPSSQNFQLNVNRLGTNSYPKIVDFFSSQNSNISKDCEPLRPVNSLPLQFKNNASQGVNHNISLDANRVTSSDTCNNNIVSGHSMMAPVMHDNSIPMRSNSSVVSGHSIPMRSNSSNRLFNPINNNLLNNFTQSKTVGNIDSFMGLNVQNGVGVSSVQNRYPVDVNLTLQNNNLFNDTTRNDLTRFSDRTINLETLLTRNLQASNQNGKNTLHYIAENFVKRSVASNSQIETVSSTSYKSNNQPLSASYGHRDNLSQMPTSGALHLLLNNASSQIKTAISHSNQKEADNHLATSLPKPSIQYRIHPFLVKDKTKEVITIEDDSFEDNTSNNKEIELVNLKNAIKERFSTQSLMVIANDITAIVSEKRKSLHETYCQVKLELEQVQAERKKNCSALTLREESLKKRLIEIVSKAKNTGCEVVQEVLKKALSKKFNLNEIGSNYSTAFSILRDLIGSWGFPITTEYINKNHFADNYIFEYPK
ncbi:protein PF3D7_1417600 isoform X4 [Hydra vulgaris]|uniref:Protein PF3D7_1417600 isoform X4 n=2 Tax=Hydra vulgaris TaxID=6087 RepID=A0ABM4C5P9_HYDVU